MEGITPLRICISCRSQHWCAQAVLWGLYGVDSADGSIPQIRCHQEYIGTPGCLRWLTTQALEQPAIPNPCYAHYISIALIFSIPCTLCLWCIYLRESWLGGVFPVLTGEQTSGGGSPGAAQPAG